jgi:hypothetical protein
MRAARLATVAVVILGTLLVASAPAMEAGAPAAPKNLRGFLLRPNEPVTHTFSRTPAFAWAPVRGAACYEFELATSRTFEQSTVVWSNVPNKKVAAHYCGRVTFSVVTTEAEQSGEDVETAKTQKTVIPPIRIPAVSISLTLPWFTGKPYALYTHVRAITTHGATLWSRPFGFNMRWEELPVPMVSKPGLVRWTPVEGATSYQVWYPDIRKSLATHTNVADQRELYTLHDDPGWWSTVRWRVRAVRQTLGASQNGLPAVSYGPWSPLYATTNPDLTTGKLETEFAVSDEVSSQWTDAAHQLMPGLTFKGNEDLTGNPWPLFRVYAFTDRDCVNVVFRGSVTGAPAFAPRISGPLQLPVNQEELDAGLAGVLPGADSETAKTFMADGTPLTSSETIADEKTGVRIDLPDVDAKTTRYFWTVVPVGIYVTAEGAFEYLDLEVPQDACEAGRVATFAKLSRPVITASGTPYVSGLTPGGRLLASAGRRPVVYSTPLVAWRPVVAATAYEIEWSRTKYPWRHAGSLVTRSTSAVLKLGPGLWYYRVRGMNAAQIGVSAMTWSAPAAVRIVRPTFRIATS